MQHHTLPKYSEIAQADIRTKLVFVLVAGGLSLSSQSTVAAVFSLTLSLPLLIYLGQQRLLYYQLAASVCLVSLIQVLLLYESSLVLFASYLCYLFLKITPMAILSMALCRTTRLAELLAALDMIRLPSAFSLAIAVTCRFVPTLWDEYGKITDSAKIRGLPMGISHLFFSPITYWEQRLLPLLSRAARLSDELAASAMTRGIESPNRLQYQLQPLEPQDKRLLLWSLLVCLSSIAYGIRELL